MILKSGKVTGKGIGSSNGQHSFRLRRGVSVFEVMVGPGQEEKLMPGENAWVATGWMSLFGT